MERVLVLGSSGSGKSTFARRLGEALNLDVIHLDSYYWQPDWTDSSDDQWERILAQLLNRDRWIMDGNYTSSLPQRMARADTVIFLDLSRVLCLWRCFQRYLKYRGGNRPELAQGCNEKIDIDFLKWIWYYPQRSRSRILQILDGQSETQVILLRGTRRIEAYLENATRM